MEQWYDFCITWFFHRILGSPYRSPSTGSPLCRMQTPSAFTSLTVITIRTYWQTLTSSVRRQFVWWSSGTKWNQMKSSEIKPTLMQDSLHVACKSRVGNTHFPSLRWMFFDRSSSYETLQICTPTRSPKPAGSTSRDWLNDNTQHTWIDVN